MKHFYTVVIYVVAIVAGVVLCIMQQNNNIKLANKAESIVELREGKAENEGEEEKERKEKKKVLVKIETELKREQEEEIPIEQEVVLETSVEEFEQVTEQATKETEEIEENIIYDITLSEELQRYTYDVSADYNVEYELLLSVMYVESGYNSNCTGLAGEQGLMQIHPVNFNWLKNKLGISDLYNPEQNILAGTFMLSELQEKWDNVYQVLGSYNRGEGGYRELAGRGTVRTDYANKVLLFKESLIKK